MVGVPSALYLAAGLLAVAASVGLAIALLAGRAAEGSDRLRLIGVIGALTYAAGHVMAGAQVGGVDIRTGVQIAGLAGLVVGLRRSSLASGGLSTLGASGGLSTLGASGGLGLLVPVVPTVPAYIAAGLAALVAVRAAASGRGSSLLSSGFAVLAIGHGLEPTRPVVGAGATVAGSLLIGAWVWRLSSRRILAKLLTAFAAALLAMAILLAAVLSTVSSAELTTDELTRLERLAEQLTADVQTWPTQALLAAQPLTRSVGTLVDQALSPADAADLYALSLSSQDFFLTVDPTGRVVNSHPPELGGAFTLVVAGDPLVTAVREGVQAESGGLLSSGPVVAAFGAVALVREGARPEEAPAGVLVTGRLVDGIWAAQQATALDVDLIGVIGGEVVFSTRTPSGEDPTAASSAQVVDGLDGRDRADLSVGGQTLFAASAPIVDPQRGTQLGTLVISSTPVVIAAVEGAQARRLFGVTLVGLVLALLTATVVTRRFVRPIGQLTDVAQFVGAGDLSRRAGITSPDEVGQLAATFDEMVEFLSDQRADLTSSALRESRLRGRLESLTTSMGDGLIAVDVDGRVITFNPAAEQMTGRDADDALGRPLDQVVVGQVLGEGASEGDGGARAADPLQISNAVDGSTATARLSLDRVDGSRVPIAASAAPVRSPNGEIIGRVYVLRDITADLQVEQMKTQFLANVSHELRTPITPIKGYANVLARRDVGADATRRFAQQILDSTTRLERIVGMIVDFAALDGGRVTFDTQPVDLSGVVDKALARWRTDHPDRIFTTTVDEWLPPVVSDPSQLGRCLDELLDNAVKFSPDGPPVLVSAALHDGRVDLSVSDRGIGIEAEAAKRLFSDFVQADGTETRHYGGLGLGLGLVGRMLEGIGAGVAVDSVPGEGTTITLTFGVAGPRPVHALPLPPAPRGSVPAPPS